MENISDKQVQTKVCFYSEQILGISLCLYLCWLLHTLISMYAQLPLLVDEGDRGRQERLAVLWGVTRVWHGREHALGNLLPMD